jgi:alkylation response protein AidB-like acyl-CoA dehydrogenase
MGESSRTTQQMFDAVERLRKIVGPLAVEMDRERKLPQQIVAVMREEGLLSIWLPTEYGGPNLSMPDSVKVIEALAQADGAIGWCACTAAINNRLAGFLPPTSARRIFVDDKAVIAGALMPTAKAATLQDAYIVSGRWGYGSGIDHCAWALGGCSVFETGQPKTNQDGAPETLIAFFPTDQCEIIDTWDVGGLRATGSHDYQVHDLLVQEKFTVRLQSEDPFCTGSLFRFPYYSAQGTAIAPVVLGLAQAALGHYLQISKSRIPRMTAAIARDDPVTQEIVGRAAATLRAARTFLREAVDELWSTVEAGSKATLDQRANARLAFAHSAEAAKYVARILHDDSGGAGLYEAQGLHRIFRDIHAATQHAQLQKVGFRTSGRVVLGLDLGGARI